MTAVVWGTSSGVVLVLLGDTVENYFIGCNSIRLKVLHVNKVKNAKCKHIDEKEVDDLNSNTFTSIGAFSLLYMFYFMLF
jgi:hypothetical protein